MNEPLPTRLASEPLIEVVSEVRFEATDDAAVNLLPGILHKQFGPFDSQRRAFSALLPIELHASDPSFAYRPQLVLTKGNHLIQVGTKAVSVACRAPYPGWTRFSAFVRDVFAVISAQSFITSFNRVSLKYIDVIEFDGTAPTLDWLEVDIRLGGSKIDQQSSSLRVEHLDGAVTTIVQVVCPVRAEQTGKPVVEGVLVDVDTIHLEDFADFLQQFPKVLDHLHDRNKNQFFSLLTADTKKRLGPEYS